MTHSVKPFSTMKIDEFATINTAESEWQEVEGCRMICGEIPNDAQESKIYIFNRIDGKVHTYKTF